MLKMPATAGSTPKVGNGGMVPVETIMPAPAKSAAAPLASAQPAAPSAQALLEPEPSGEGTKKSGRERKMPLRSARPIVGNTAGLSTAATTPPSAPAAVTASAASTPTAAAAATATGSASSTNAFGRGAFGGRH
jgi:hypothetical protein